MQINLKHELQSNAYPGRGIILGLTPDGGHAAIAYFIMGRSENSRNRIFVAEGDDLKTQAFDPAKMTDPSLIIYHPVRRFGAATTIVTNGDQTDTIVEYLRQDKSFADALRTRTFEPDPPNYTPRISGILHHRDGRLSYSLSILKSAYNDGNSCRRFFFDYPEPVSGQGHFIHTYRCDGNPIPSFEGEPEQINLVDDLDAFTDLIWQNLNPDNKVSLFTRFICLATGETQTRIVNKNQ